jgi:hypothetical protein
MILWRSLLIPPCPATRPVTAGSSAPRAAAVEKALAPVLVLPGAMDLGGSCRSGFFSKRLAAAVFDRALML